MILQAFDIPKAADLITKGDLVAFPTETVYGLGASVFLPDAIQKIFNVKGRPQDNPLIVHIAHLNQLSQIAKEIPNIFFALAEAFFPGPLTVLLNKKDAVPNLVSANLPTIGVRMPAHPLAQQLINVVGSPLVAPSANLSGKPSSTTAQHVFSDFGDTIAAIIDGGPCQYGIESTVLKLHPNPMILRPGAITQQQIEALLKKPVLYADEYAETPHSPGLKYKHYAPKAKVMLFDTPKSLEQYVEEHPQPQRVVLKHLKSDELYACFRQADAEQKEEILILCDARMQENKALMNRIHRACERYTQTT